MTAVTLTVVVNFDGADAYGIATKLRIDAHQAELDQAATNMIRAHLANAGDARDWRVTGATVRPEVQP